MDLEWKRDVLQADIDQISSRISQLQSQLAVGGATSARVSDRFVARRKRPRAARGELKAKIFEALSNAGSVGVRVRDLAGRLGTRPANIHAWFQNSTRIHRQIKKIGSAHYRLEGSLPASKSSVAAQEKQNGTRSTRSKGKRGQLGAAILGTLRGAGEKGIKLNDLAGKVGAKYRNLSVWFATTGKKNKAIKKLAPGHYRVA